MKRLSIAGAAMLLSTAAVAANKPTILMQTGAWTAYSMIASDGVTPLCGMYTIGGNRRMYVTYFRHRFVVHFYKASWRVTVGTKVKTTLRTDSGETDTGTGVAYRDDTGQQTYLAVNVNQGAENGFLDRIARADKLTISFPDGDEADWTVRMDGSRPVLDALRQCAKTLDERDAATATQPFKPKAETPATQPTTPQAEGIAPETPKVVKPGAKRDDGAI
ncbi:hypothetical protein [Bradyrhizobium sp. UFLA05-112]